MYTRVLPDMYTLIPRAVVLGILCSYISGLNAGVIIGAVAGAIFVLIHIIIDINWIKKKMCKGNLTLCQMNKQNCVPDIDCITSATGNDDSNQNSNIRASPNIVELTELTKALSLNCVSHAWDLKRLENLNGVNLCGHGTTIAIIDTAIDQNFPSFRAKKVRYLPKDFPIVTGSDEEILVINCLNYNAPAPLDRTYATLHGTVCSAVAVGVQCGTTPRGVAPGAKLIVYEIAKGDYFSTVALLEALDHIGKRSQYGSHIDVISISYECSEEYEDLIHKKIETLIKQGITIVAAAGNRGQYQARASIPARFNEVISVGALDDCGNKASLTPPVKIDCFAPGKDIEFPSIQQKLSGTSFATPAVAGLILLLKQFANAVGSPAKDHIHDAKVLQNIFSNEMFVKSEDGTTFIFDPVEFFVRIKNNPNMLNDIIQKYLLMETDV